MRKRFFFLTIIIFLLGWMGLPTFHGYLHAADPMILLAAMMLPLPYALTAAGIASLGADLVKGYLLLAPVTLVIKVLMVLLAFGLSRLPAAKKYPALLPLPALYLPVLGYYLAEGFALMLEGYQAPFIYAASTLQKDLLQATAGVLVFIILYDLWKGIAAGRAEIRRRKAEEEEPKDE